MSYGKKPRTGQAIRVAVVGNFRRNDFRAVVQEIGRVTPAVFFDDFSLFLQDSKLGQNFDLIFLLAASFGQYTSRDISRLQHHWPLTRIVMIAGSLAEGERRTGQLPPELLRYYWHQWQTEFMPSLTAFCELRPSPWELPHCSSDEARLLKFLTDFKPADSLAVCNQTKIAAQRRALIIAADSAMRDMLSDFAKQKNLTTTTTHPANFELCAPEFALPPSEIWFDVVSENFAETLGFVSRLRSRWPKPVPLTVFYNAPRPHEAEQLTQAGASRIISKPFLIDF
jgi:hypothetical protein